MQLPVNNHTFNNSGALSMLIPDYKERNWLSPSKENGTRQRRVKNTKKENLLISLSTHCQGFSGPARSEKN